VTQPPKRYQLQAFKTHARDWAGNLYVYPVISRRSGGLSVGVNLNPDAACNFDCVYCQVDRTQPPRVRKVDLDILRRELDDLLTWAIDGSLFTHPQFAGVPAELHRINDIAFSGDGEPTTCAVFAQAVQVAADLKRAHGLAQVKIVLITDACYLMRPNVVAGLQVLDANQGEIWAKLDAGTEAFFQQVNRPNVTLADVLENITHAARVRPVCIQSLWMRLRDAPPSKAEIRAYAEGLRRITDQGGRIALVQVYTVARPPAESYVTPLLDAELDAIAADVTAVTGLRVATYYGVAAG
jgi:wyosine [tRNA(Phe)-imidazoG37] synthetase (radical SAM superfamily)